MTDVTTRIDMISLDCIECHDKYANFEVGTLGAGNWDHFSTAFTHPIGVSYEEESSRRADEYYPASGLSKEIRLFDGKIGCGTCHNIYSKVRKMLVMENRGSKLSQECHIK